MTVILNTVMIRNGPPIDGEKRRDLFFMKVIQKMILGAVSLSTLLCTSAYAADLSTWAVSDYQSANAAGLVSYSVVSNNLKDSITREEFCELAMNLYKKLTNEEVITPVGSPFSDTDSKAVAQAYAYGIVNGTSGDKFTPDRLVTREEMAKMLVSTLTASEVVFNIADGADSSYVNSFADGGDVSAWAMSSVNTALDYGLMTGVNDVTLAPLKATSREQAIVSINRSYAAFGTSGYSMNETPEILAPSNGQEISVEGFDVSWLTVPNAESYHVIIKNTDGTPVILKDTIFNNMHFDDTIIGTGSYSVTVGAVLADGSEVYSLPVDFHYTYVTPQATPAPTPAPTAAPVSAAPAASTSSSYTSSNPARQAIIDTAAQYLGTPYLWAGTTPAGFDCSGFAQYVYSKNGYSITRTTYTQWDNDGTYVSKSELQPGDLVYFGSEGSPSHVGIYVGDGMMIHSPRTGDVVKYSTITSGYYADCYMGAKRIIN